MARKDFTKKSLHVLRHLRAGEQLLGEKMSVILANDFASVLENFLEVVSPEDDEGLKTDRLQKRPDLSDALGWTSLYRRIYPEFR